MLSTVYLVFSCFSSLKVIFLWTSKAEAANFGLSADIWGRDLGMQITELWNYFHLTLLPLQFSSFFSYLEFFFFSWCLPHLCHEGFLNIFFSFKCSLNPANHEIWKVERTKTSCSEQLLLICFFISISGEFWIKKKTNHRYYWLLKFSVG